MEYKETEPNKFEAEIKNGQLNIKAKAVKDDEGNVTVKMPSLKVINDFKEKHKDKLNKKEVK